MSRLTDHKYLIFDVYGTLVDWETAIYNALKPLLDRFPSTSQWTRKDVLNVFVSVETDIQAQHPSLPYTDLLAQVYQAIEARLAAAEAGSDIEPTKAPPTAATTDPATSAASTIPDAAVKFGNSVKQWAPFPDSTKALHDLSTKYKLIVLSNVDHVSFAYTHQYLSEGITPPPDIQQSSPTYTRPSPNLHPGDLWLPQRTPGSKSPFSLVMTAQDVGAYKPALDGFNKIFEAIRSEPLLSGTEDTLTIEEIKSRTLIVAQSLPHDHVPARRLGLHSVWISRPQAVFVPDDGGKEIGYTWRFDTLGDFARAVEQEGQ